MCREKEIEEGGIEGERAGVGRAREGEREREGGGGGEGGGRGGRERGGGRGVSSRGYRRVKGKNNPETKTTASITHRNNF